MNHATRARRVARRALLFGGVLVCFAGATLSTVAALDARSDAAESGDDRDEIETLQLRTELRRLFLHETNVMMLTVLGEASPAELDRVRADRAAAVTDAGARLAELALGGGARAGASEFRAFVDEAEELLADEVDPVALFDAAWYLSSEGRPGAVMTPEQQALNDLLSADSTGALVLNDALDAAYVMEQPTVPELMAEYVSRAESYIRSASGYLGPDPAEPLVDSWVYMPTAPEPDPAVEIVAARVTESRLWDYDRWTRSWQEVGPDERPGDPPLTLAELVAEADAVDNDVRAVVDRRLGEVLASHERAVAESDRNSTVLFGIALVAALAGLVALVVVGVRLARSVREHADRLTRDPLTGSGNRLQLDAVAETVERAAADHHHVVVAVDLDRFKLVNDTWGHAVGDQVLVEVARLLDHVVEQWQTRIPGTTGAVIRMGGDEFLLTLHTPRPIDQDAVRADLDRIRTTTIAAADQQVELRFSMGLASAQGACSLVELVSKADLAAYEEKADRARALSEPSSAGTGWSVRQPV